MQCPALSTIPIDATIAGSPAFVLCRGKDKRLRKGEYAILDHLCPAYCNQGLCCGCNFASKGCLYVERGIVPIPDPVANVCGHSYCPPVNSKEPPRGCHICEPILRARLVKLLEERKTMLRSTVITKEKLDSALEDAGEEDEDLNGDNSEAVVQLTTIVSKGEILMTQCKDKLLSLRPPK